ncbi:hypothetical protein B0H34DRAFT_736402 [Crassisporium funariophilum]|nr:hypothetical protein B0H34DRAFT_736402 [Crassisporium funariophilum]
MQRQLPLCSTFQPKLNRMTLLKVMPQGRTLTVMRVQRPTSIWPRSRARMTTKALTKALRRNKRAAAPQSRVPKPNRLPVVIFRRTMTMKKVRLKLSQRNMLDPCLLWGKFLRTQRAAAFPLVPKPRRSAVVAMQGWQRCMPMPQARKPKSTRAPPRSSLISVKPKPTVLNVSASKTTN